MLYAICRQLRPSVVVETGVWEGFSSAFILQALQDNGSGALYSIDLPHVVQRGQGPENLPRGKTTGYRVPTRLRGRWDLLLGDSRTVLPRVLGAVSGVDFLHHDSLHTYERLMFENDAVWPNLRTGGVLAGDDINRNSAIADFCQKHGLASTITTWNRGFAWRS